MTDAFEKREAAYEAEYFHKKDQELVQKLRGVFHQNVDKKSIAQATGIADEAVLDRLAQLGLRGELMAAFQLYPLVAVAWADGRVDDRERKAVIKAAEAQGIAPGSAAHTWLEDRLGHGLPEDASKVWFAYAESLKNTLSAEQLNEVREDILALCQSVADASGGLFNFAFNVSRSEQNVIDEVKRALTA